MAPADQLRSVVSRIRTRLRWQPGRQGTGYRKLLLGQGARWDLYVLDYPPGTAIPTHVDPVPGCRHWRANLVLWGERAFEGRASLRAGPLVVFRPDVTPHSVATVRRRRVVLSFGVAL
jgi:hypothetical protein